MPVRGVMIPLLESIPESDFEHRRHAGGRKSTLCSCVFEPLRWRQHNDLMSKVVNLCSGKPGLPVKIVLPLAPVKKTFTGKKI